MGRKSIGAEPMTAAERQRRRRTRLAGLHQHVSDRGRTADRNVELLRAQLIEMERENQQRRERLTGMRPVIAPSPAPSSQSAPAASGWLNRVVASRKR